MILLVFCQEGEESVLHVGLDLSRRRVDVCVISAAGELAGQFPAPVDRDGLYGLNARVLAELSFRDLVPTIWLPDEQLRGERERSRFRLYLVKHPTSLKNRIHATLITFGYQRSMSDLFGVRGRRLLASLEIPEPWRGNLDATLVLVDDLDRRIAGIETELQRSGAVTATCRC
jgi:hypothetical protein